MIGLKSRIVIAPGPTCLLLLLFDIHYVALDDWLYRHWLLDLRDMNCLRFRQLLRIGAHGLLVQEFAHIFI